MAATRVVPIPSQWVWLWAVWKMILFARATASRSTIDWRIRPVMGSISLRLSRLAPSTASSVTVWTAMPLATSPALYPPMPSASTMRPVSGSEPIASSLCSLTLPVSVISANLIFPRRLIGTFLLLCSRRISCAVAKGDRHLTAVRKAVFGSFRQRLGQHRIHARRNARAAPRDRHRILRGNLRHQHCYVRGLERHLAGQELV